MAAIGIQTAQLQCYRFPLGPNTFFLLLMTYLPHMSGIHANYLNRGTQQIK